MSDHPSAGLAPLNAAPGGFSGFPERAFVHSLRSGWAWLIDPVNAWAWERILGDLSPAEIAQTLALFKARAAPIIRAGYPTDNADVPQVTVLVEEEAAASGFLGDLADDEPWGVEGALRQGQFKAQSLSVSITTDHPDVCLYLYRLTGSILHAHADWFVAPPPDGAGFQMAEWKSGGAVIPDPRAPDRLWGRQHRWMVTGLDGAGIPIPPPPRAVSVHTIGTNVAGVAGRVTPG